MDTITEYAQIPSTSDLNYWEVKRRTGNYSKSITYVPKDMELHRRLKTEAWEKIQAKLPFNLRSRIFYASK
ncbi:hypothetical protein GO755_00080 [Spirosoma sp. HMF4905]|uniref:Uncharacterized protein n=1 Tax=Spirosoma arboris TaxID=2682092 RepID=A0A7K1S3L4_9BACT|nr:hypothetical protein [Spirosoma arboris]MVM28409.1 hypothetical protein [Spirosoma arboris]